MKRQGEFTWHEHADNDEFFLVLDGQLTIQMRDRDVVLGPRELFVVPRGIEHFPRADAETAVLLLEPGTVITTSHQISRHDPTCATIFRRPSSYSAICTAVAPDAVRTRRIHATARA